MFICIGFLLIGLSFIHLNNNKENISEEWTTYYQKGNIEKNQISYYQNDKYKRINLKNNEKYYIIPDIQYSSIINQELFKYKNDLISIIQYNQVIKENDLQKNIDNLKKNDISDLIILKRDIENHNVLYWEKIVYQNTYYENLYLFIKEDTGYYEIIYSINDSSFTDDFISEITNFSKYENYELTVNANNEAKLFIDTAKGKKELKLWIDSSKYTKDDTNLNDDSKITIYSKNDSEYQISISLYYTSDNNSLDEEKKFLGVNQIQGYDVGSYYYEIESGIENGIYNIYVDDNVKIKIEYDSKFDNLFDISDFMNFTFN